MCNYTLNIYIMRLCIQLKRVFVISVIEPITSQAQMRLCTKPEKEKFSIPKVLLKILFEEIAIGLTRSQVWMNKE